MSRYRKARIKKKLLKIFESSVADNRSCPGCSQRRKVLVTLAIPSEFLTGGGHVISNVILLCRQCIKDTEVYRQTPWFTHKPLDVLVSHPEFEGAKSGMLTNWSRSVVLNAEHESQDMLLQMRNLEEYGPPLVSERYLKRKTKRRAKCARDRDRKTKARIRGDTRNTYQSTGATVAENYSFVTNATTAGAQ